MSEEKLNTYDLTVVCLVSLPQGQIVEDSCNAAASGNDACKEHDEEDVGSEGADEEHEHQDREDDPVMACVQSQQALSRARGYLTITGIVRWRCQASERIAERVVREGLIGGEPWNERGAVAAVEATCARVRTKHDAAEPVGCHRRT